MIEKKDCVSSKDWTKEGMERYREYKEIYQNKKTANADERKNK